MSNLPSLRVIDIVAGTSVDGPGLRTSVYLAGCRHACKGCHNPSTWDFSAGSDISGSELAERLITEKFNVTFSGGDPMYQARELLPVARRLKESGISLWCYTGFTLPALRASGNPYVAQLLDLIDVLVDGPYIEELRNPELCFRGSANQNIIDMKSGRILNSLYDSYNEF